MAVGRAVLLDPSSNVRLYYGSGFSLDTVTLSVDVSERNKLRFLIDTEADLCLCKHSSIMEGTNAYLATGDDLGY
jgi:hypothetical protein